MKDEKTTRNTFLNSNNRIRNPFIGSFIFSWIVFNWKPVTYFLLSKDNVIERIEVLETNYENIWNALIFPLILSLFYVLALPFVNQWMKKITSKLEKEKRKMQQNLKIENIEYLKDSAEKEKELEDIRSGNKDISQLNEKVESLKQENQRLKDTIQDKDEVIGDYGEQLDKVTTDLQKSNRELAEEKIKSSKDIGLRYMGLQASGYMRYIEPLAHAIANKTKLPNKDVPNNILNQLELSGMIKKTDIAPGYHFSGDGLEFYFYRMELDRKNRLLNKSQNTN